MANIVVETLVTGQLGANCFLIVDKHRGEVLIIDPGDDAEYIMQYVGDLGLKPVKIIATHGHFDHIMAAGELQLNWKVPFLISRKDEFLVKNMKQSAKRFILIDSGPPPNIDEYIDGDRISFNKHNFEVIKTPGHTPGSVSLYDAKSGSVFVGDVIFANGGVGRYDFSYCDGTDLYESVGKILALPDNTVIYSGHGPSSAVGEEKKFHEKT